jgi:hypothetical protein
VVTRILQEEQLRLQIKTKLEIDAKPKTFTWWDFLNSSLGIFVLTSLFVTGLGTALGWWHEGYQHREARIDAARKIFAEYDARLGQIRTYTAQIAKTTDEDKRGELIMYEYYAARGTPEYQPTSPEFRGVPLAGMIIQLEVLGYQDRSDESAAAAAHALDTGVELKDGKELQSPHGYRLFTDGRLKGYVDALQAYRDSVWKNLVG